jgi:signal transduction histidine kinase
MNTSTTPDFTPLHEYSPSANMLWSLTPSKIAQEQPGQFASALAHEIRDPLSTIKLAGEMLRSRICNDDQKVFLDIILRGSGRINEILTDLLTSFQAEEMRSEKHSINQLLDEVLSLAGDKVSLKHIQVIKEYSAQNCKIVLDRTKMKMALTNIIINAIEAMNGEKGVLKLATKSIDGKYALKIEDNGCGISKGNLKKIFKPFFTSKPEGLGLGLATTYDILWANHVDVTVESEEGKGTRFVLLFDKKHQHNHLHKKS